MLSLQYVKDKGYGFGHVLTKEDKEAIIKENEGKDFSYVCLMKEMFGHHVTVEGAVHGWSGVKIFQY